MAVQTLAQGTRSAAALVMSTLAASTYICSAAIDLGSAIPLDETIEVEVTPSTTPTGNKQLVLFAKFSLDNTNWGTGPESGSSASQELDLHFVGVVPINDTSVHRKFFSMAGLPTTRYMKLIAKNDCGVALTSGNAYRADITGVIT